MTWSYIRVWIWAFWNQIWQRRRNGCLTQWGLKTILFQYIFMKPVKSNWFLSYKKISNTMLHQCTDLLMENHRTGLNPFQSASLKIRNWNLRKVKSGKKMSHCSLCFAVSALSGWSLHNRAWNQTNFSTFVLSRRHPGDSGTSSYIELPSEGHSLVSAWFAEHSFASSVSWRWSASCALCNLTAIYWKCYVYISPIISDQLLGFPAIHLLSFHELNKETI